MKHQYTALLGLTFLFIGTAAAAQEDMQAKIKTILETLAAHEEVVQNHLEKISALEKKNAELEQRLATAQSTANTAVSKADAAQTTANTAMSHATAAQNTANSGVSKADAAQAAANVANGKRCYFTGDGAGASWSNNPCPAGGTKTGGIHISTHPDNDNVREKNGTSMVGIRSQDGSFTPQWTSTKHLWLCCL